jgi:hypothetical protein
MAPEIRAFIAANDSQLNSKEIMVLTSLCLLLNIDGLVEELGLRPVLAQTRSAAMSALAPLMGVDRTSIRRAEIGVNEP